jgi:hypothetical protein
MSLYERANRVLDDIRSSMEGAGPDGPLLEQPESQRRRVEFSPAPISQDVVPLIRYDNASFCSCYCELTSDQCQP